MNRGEVITQVRNVLDDTAQPYLWDSTELELITEQAYLDAIVRIDGNLDSTESLAKVAITLGAAEYELEPEILQVLRAKLDSETKPLVKQTIAALDEFRTGWEATTGVPTHYIDSLDRHKIRLYPIPDANNTLSLTVKKLDDCGLRNDSDELSFLPTHVHYGVVYLVCAMAHQKRDEDSVDMQKVSYFENKAEIYFGQRKSANAQEFERDFTPKQVRIRFFA